MSEHPLHRIMHPRSIAVVGASNDAKKMGTVQVLNIMGSGYPGEILPIHPKEGTVLGRKAYPRIRDLPYAPDVAFFIVPTPLVLEMLDDFGKLGVKRAIITTAGFREVGREGAELEKELVEVAGRHGIRFLGPNCIGVLNAHLPLNTTFLPYLHEPGPLGIASQSGTYVTQVFPYLRRRGIRLSQALSVGNGTDLDVVDCLEYLGEDPDTRAIALYLEGVRRGAEFVETARRVSRAKPIVALYVGGTEAGARAGASHTGSMAGPDALYDGMLRQAGVIRARNIGELFQWSWALATQPVPRGKRVAILTQSGGPASSMADACNRAGLEVPELSAELQDRIRPLIPPTASPRNPIDLTYIKDRNALIRHLPSVLLESGEVDGLLLFGIMDSGVSGPMYELVKDHVSLSREEFISETLMDLWPLASLVRSLGKPVVAASFMDASDHAISSAQKYDVPTHREPEPAAWTMAALCAYAAIRARPVPERIAPAGPRPVAALLAGELAARRRVLDEHRAKELLAAYGIPVAREALATDLEAAVAAAHRIGYPVAVKACAEGLAHKTEAGLVELGVASDGELAAAFGRIRERAGAAVPVLVQEMLRGARELVAGITRFPGFGPCVMFGLGGVFTEALRDVTFRVAPLSPADARAMQDELRAGRLLGAFRGMPPVDRDALADLLVGLGRLALENPAIDEIDVNPLIVVGNRPVAADALVVLRQP